MAGQKVAISFDIPADARDMLQLVAQHYKLSDESKALRCLFDRAATDGDREEIFGRSQMPEVRVTAAPTRAASPAAVPLSLMQ